MTRRDEESGRQSNSPEGGNPNRSGLSHQSRMVEIFDILEPEVEPMRPEAEEAIVKKVLKIQRERLKEGARPGVDGSRKRSRTFKALIPAAAMAVAAVAVVLALTLTGQQAVVPVRHTATLVTEGRVRILAQGAIWRTYEGTERVDEGSLVKTRPDSRAYIRFDDGSRARLDHDSSLALNDLEAKDIKLEHVYGSSYHRVNKGTGYAVDVSDVSVTARGTAFNVSKAPDETIQVLSIEDEVEVEVAKRERHRLAQGQELVVLNGERRAEIKDANPVTLGEEWLLTSMREDVADGFNPGVYADLNISLEDGVSKEGDQPDRRDEGEGEEPRPEELRVELSASATGQYASLNWNLSAQQGFDSLAVLRSGEGTPAYPGNVILTFPGTATISCTDTRVSPGQTYSYMVVLLEGDTVVSRSNISTVIIPDPGSLTVNADVGEEGVALSWSIANPPEFDAYVICRSEVTSSPTYPPHPDDVAVRLNTDRTTFDYLDRRVTSGKTYHYRIALVAGNAVIFYSRPVTVNVP